MPTPDLVQLGVFEQTIEEIRKLRILYIHATEALPLENHTWNNDRSNI